MKYGQYVVGCRSNYHEETVNIFSFLTKHEDLKTGVEDLLKIDKQVLLHLMFTSAILKRRFPKNGKKVKRARLINLC